MVSHFDRHISFKLRNYSVSLGIHSISFKSGVNPDMGFDNKIPSFGMYFCQMIKQPSKSIGRLFLNECHE